MVSIREIEIGLSCLLDRVSFAGDKNKVAILHFKKFADGHLPMDRVIHNTFAVRYLEHQMFVQHKSVQDIFKDVDWREFTIKCYYHTDINGVGGYTWNNNTVEPLWINGLDPYTYFKDVIDNGHV